MRRPKGSTTTTREFLDILHAAGNDQQLVFHPNEAPLVAAGYHVTELKAVAYNTIGLWWRRRCLGRNGNPTLESRRRTRERVHDSEEVFGDL
jgi:hypothetical protein